MQTPRPQIWSSDLNHLQSRLCRGPPPSPLFFLQSLWTNPPLPKSISRKCDRLSMARVDKKQIKIKKKTRVDQKRDGNHSIHSDTMNHAVPYLVFYSHYHQVKKLQGKNYKGINVTKYNNKLLHTLTIAVSPSFMMEEWASLLNKTLRDFILTTLWGWNNSFTQLGSNIWLTMSWATALE